VQPYARARRLLASANLSWTEARIVCSLLGADYNADYENHAVRTDLSDIILTAPVTGRRIDDRGFCMADTVRFIGATFGRDVWQFSLWVDQGLPISSPLLAHHRFEVRWPSDLLAKDYGLFWDAQFGGVFRA
jgi:hypothetical protein